VDNSEETDLAVPSFSYGVANDEVRMSVPVSATKDYVVLRKGVKINNFLVDTNRSTGGYVLWDLNDRAEASKSFVVGTPSCVRPGP
jgi:hypothetical protein